MAYGLSINTYLDMDMALCALQVFGFAKHKGDMVDMSPLCSMTLNNYERRNIPSFAFSHRIRLLCWPITS